MFAHQCHDTITAIQPWVRAYINNESKEKIDETWNAVAIPQFRNMFAQFFEAQLTKNESGYLIGNKITWIDFFAANLCEMMQHLGDRSILDEYPNLRLHWESIYTHPKLIAAIEKQRQSKV
uniref:GST C-terminal domain-containing protein n=1 Tax=Panagrolaimus superbus TaxID=310955 RepID=A0A914YD72_9BILA